MPDHERSAVWEGAPHRLDRVMPELGLARSRTQASDWIAGGHVRVDDARATKTGMKVDAGSRIDVSAPDEYVSRAAHKLIAGLDRFGVDPTAKIALDLGASTGGFTQVLLEHGARAVLAIDVGHGQLVDDLRQDERVRLVEGCNARDLTAESLASATGEAEPPSLVVADLSFISLTLILPAIARCAAGNAEVVLLIKPQFEVGRVKDGVVTDARLRTQAIRAVMAAAAEAGFATRGLELSPIEGGYGNREFLGYFVRDDQPDPTEWEARAVALGQQEFAVPRGPDASQTQVNTQVNTPK